MKPVQYIGGELYIENVKISDIATLHATPTYCYSTAQIATNFQSWKAALSKVLPADSFTICYAAKANSNQAIIQLLSKLGAGADVVSLGEMIRAFKAKIPPHKIVFAGVGKTDAELTRAIKNKILQINVESESELNLISAIAMRENTTAHIAIRVNPNVDAKTHAKITTGLKENKFGVDIDDAPALYLKARQLPNIAATGVSMHIGSQLTDIDPFKDAFTALAKLVMDLRKQGHTIERVDLGGGLGVQYKDEKIPSLDDYAALIQSIILPLNVHVIVEPGRALVADAGILISKVLHLKHGHEKSFLIIDAGMNDLARPALYEAYHHILPADEKHRQPQKKYDVVGPVCETSDIFQSDYPLADTLKADDIVAIMTAGAYGSSMASTYNTRPLAAEVLISDKQIDLIRKRQTLDELFMSDSVPAWLL